LPATASGHHPAQDDARALLAVAATGAYRIPYHHHPGGTLTQHCATPFTRSGEGVASSVLVGTLSAGSGGLGQPATVPVAAGTPERGGLLGLFCPPDASPSWTSDDDPDPVDCERIHFGIRPFQANTPCFAKRDELFCTGTALLRCVVSRPSISV